MEKIESLSIQNLKMEKDAAVRAKDALVAQLRIVKKKLQEAEEEQYKAEEDAAALRAELESLHRREEYSNMISSSSTSDQNRLLEREVAIVKVELQSALQLLQQEQQKVVEEQERVADLLVEREQLKNALNEAQQTGEEHANPADSFLAADTSKDKSVQDYQLRELASMVERLEIGRQKLLAEIDSQSVEIERLFSENDSLAACLRETSAITGQWEHQVQDCLQQNANLRAELNDLRTRQAQRTDLVPLKSIGSSDAEKEKESSKLQVELGKAKGHAEALSAQVLQLSADLNHAMQHISSLNWLYKPVLASIENRLMQLKQHGKYNEVTPSIIVGVQ